MSRIPRAEGASSPAPSGAGGRPGPTVSVVIPAYNAAGFIEKTLDSVRGQTYADYEVVVVDDGSSDGTHGVARDWLRRHEVAGRSIRQENKKIAGARNTGMREAKGKFIALLDHDDLWYPDKLSVVMEAFRSRPEAGLVCHGENITRDGRVLRTTRPAGPRRGLYEHLLFAGNELSPSASVFKKDLALSIGGFRENPEFNTVEDYDFWMRLSRVTPFFFLERVLGEYQVVERAASRRVEYHHANLEAMLRDHFAGYFGDRPGFWARCRIRRRLSAVHRSALGQLMERGDSTERQRDYALRMLRECAWEPRNLARALLWASRSGLGTQRSGPPS